MSDDRAPKPGEMLEREVCKWCAGRVIPGTTCPKSIACPSCHAQPGARCQRPSGHLCTELHAPRVEAAEQIDRDAGILGRC